MPHQYYDAQGNAITREQVQQRIADLTYRERQFYHSSGQRTVAEAEEFERRQAIAIHYYTAQLAADVLR